MLDADPIRGVGYQTAGRFSRFHIERHSLDSYFALYEALDGATGRDALAIGVQEILGIDLSTLVEEFDESSPCSPARWRYFDHECTTLPVTPWESSSHWTAEVDLHCSAQDVIGPRRDLVWTLRAIEVEEAGSHRLSIESVDDTAQVGIFPCRADCFADRPELSLPGAAVATGGSASVFLDAGRHWIRVEHAAESEAAVTVTIER